MTPCLGSPSLRESIRVRKDPNSFSVQAFILCLHPFNDPFLPRCPILEQPMGLFRFVCLEAFEEFVVVLSLFIS